MEYIDEMLNAGVFLIRAGLIYLTYAVARDSSAKSKCPRWQSYAWTVTIVAGLAILSASTLGTHREDMDPIHGGGDTIVDFEVTIRQQIKHGLWALTALLIPALMGTHKGLSLRLSAPSIKNANGA